MSSDYLAILQLTAPPGPDRLEQAYRLTRARYQRLTARGPLRFYRQDLLTDAERAYQKLKKALSPISVETGKYRKISLLRQGPSVVAQRAAQRGDTMNTKGPVKSPVKKGSILSAELLRLKSRTLNELRQNPAADPAPPPNIPNQVKTNDREKALIEDAFCRQVIYRLEGDIIRYDSRRELLQIADERGIHLFRANMLMAQIVEAVRQHKLYEPSPTERQINKNPPRRKWRRLAALAAGVVLITVVIDFLLIRYINRL